MDPIEELGRELRDKVGSDFRAEAEAGESMAAIGSARGRTVTEVAQSLAQRGARVRVEVGDRSFYGPVVAGGQDLLTLTLDDALVVVNLAAAHLVTLLGPGDADARLRRGASSLKSALYELEGTEGVELGLLGGDALTGMIRVVGHDHVMFRDDHERIVPIGSIAWLIQRSA